MRESATQPSFPFMDRRDLRVRFDAEPISSDGGAVLLRQVDRRLGLLASLAATLPDERDARYVEQPVVDMLRQRVLQIALGYEDCNDAATLRHDPVLKACCDRDPVEGSALASQPTLSRLENSVGVKSCYRFAVTLFESHVARHRRRPKRLVLDIDTTDDTTHGQQQLSFFSAFYNEHVYLPLLGGSGNSARGRSGNSAPSRKKEGA